MKHLLIASSLICLSLAAVAASPVENLVPNAAFELGAVGWHVRTQRARLDPWTCAEVTFPTEGAWKGKSLKVVVPQGGAVRISSERLCLEPGVKYFVSARVKAETPGRMHLTLAGPMLNDWWTGCTKGMDITNGWQRLSGFVTVAQNHHEALFSLDWGKPGAFWLDDVQVSRVEGAAKPPCVEAGFDLADTYAAPGPRKLRFRAIAYDGDGGRDGARPSQGGPTSVSADSLTCDFVLKAEHPATGWKQERKIRMDLPRGVAVEKEVEFDLTHCGELLLSSDAPGNIPVYFAVMQKITEPLPKLGDEFSVGVNETGVFPPIGSWDQNCQCVGRSFAEHLALLKACGVQHIRAFNEDYSHLPIFNPERGVFDYARLDPWLDAMAAADMPYYMTIKFDLERRKDMDGWKHWSAARKKAWYLFKESQPTGRNNPTWPDKKIEWLPNVDDVAAICGELAKHCKGKTAWYELFNEPNLDLSDTRDCVRYQKAVSEAMKKADPSCRIAGVCTTQDFGTDDAADFAGGCLQNGIAPYLDALSFHPYSTAMDNGIQGAASFIRRLKDQLKPTPHVGLWNSECFYLLNRSDYPVWRKKDPMFLRPQNLARRNLIDLGEGVKVSSSLHVMQLFRPHFDEMTQHTGEHSGHKLTPTDSAVGLAAFAKLMTRATPVRSLEKSLTDGLCGYLYTLRDGRPAAVLWAYENLRKFVVRTDATAYDMYGNTLEGQDHLIDERPVYVVGKGNPEAFFRTLAIRPEKPVLAIGARRLDAKTVAVELVNMTDGDLRTDVTVGTETRPVLLTAKERRAVAYDVGGGRDRARPSPGGPTSVSADEIAVTCRTDVQTDVFTVRAEPTRKTAKSGERVTVGPMTFSVTLAEEGVLVDATTKDDTRTVGTFQLPWTGDTIELFLDANPDTHLDEARDATGTFRLFVLPPTPDPASAPGHRARALSTCTRKLDVRGIQTRIDENGKEFGCKLTIPWSYFGGKRLNAIGFDIIADDFDPATQKRTAAHAWCGDTANFESRFKWGRIVAETPEWIRPAEKPPRPKAVALLKKTVVSSGKVAKAIWRSSGLGVYEIYVNGRVAGAPDILKPGFTDARRRRTEYTHDVTAFLSGPTNVFSVVQTCGWFSDDICHSRKVLPTEGSAFRGTIELEYADGRRERILTGPDWLACYGGPLMRAGIYEGDLYDARIPATGKWAPAAVDRQFGGEVSPYVGARVVVRDDLRLKPVSCIVWQGASGAKGTNAYGRINVLRRPPADAPVALKPGERLIVDFGQNHSGVTSFRVSGPSGARLCVRHAEMLNDGNGERARGNDGPAGSPYYANLRSLVGCARTVYLLKGKGVESYAPRFTFFGYRYAEFETSAPVTLHEIVGEVFTSVAQADERGTVETGDKSVNRFLANCRWGLYSNYLSVPTDCPQRDERLGWSGDTQAFSLAALYTADVAAALDKWLVDMADAQGLAGDLPNVAPFCRHATCGRGGVGWADAGLIVPYNCWRMNGDTAILRRHWPEMLRYADYLLVGNGPNGGFGDWLAYEKNDDTIRAFLCGAFRLWDLAMLAEMADALGDTKNADRFRAERTRRQAWFARDFQEKDGTVKAKYRRQTSDAYALFLGLVPESARKAVADDLCANIASHGNKLQTGFLGTAILLDALSSAGRDDVAYTLLLQHGHPSWLYSVDQGATTIWERWNSYTKDKGFGDVSMNSFNHYAYGSVLRWIYSTAAGIRPDPKGAGFRTFVLAPRPDRRLGRLKATYRTPFGTIESAWAYDKNGDCTFRFKVPEGTTALVTLPGKPEEKLGPGRYVR